MGRGLRRDDGRFAVLLCVAVVAVNAAIALSDRMAGLWNSTADGINTSRDPVSEVVASTGVTRSQGDWAVHSVLWGVSAMVAMVVLVRARHATAVVVAFLAAGITLEFLQNVLATERSAQATDIGGNLLGLACGVMVGVAARRFAVRRDPVPMRGRDTQPVPGRRPGA